MIRKIILGVVLTVVITIPAFFVWMYVKQPTKTLTTTVSVIEGAVELFEIDKSGHRKFRDVVKAGETASVVSVEKEAGFIAKSVFIGLIRAFQEGAINWSNRVVEDRWAGFIPEKQVEEFAKGAEKTTPLSGVTIRITREGFEAYGIVDLGLKRMGLAATGIIAVDPFKKRLYLKLYSLSLGRYAFPKFFLKEIEAAFSEIYSPQKFPLEILEMEYQEDGILIYARRKE